MSGKRRSRVAARRCKLTWGRCLRPLPPLAQLPVPDFVVISKPDVYDHDLAVMNFLTQSGYQPKTNFAAFVIWSPDR